MELLRDSNYNRFSRLIVYGILATISMLPTPTQSLTQSLDDPEPYSNNYQQDYLDIYNNNNVIESPAAHHRAKRTAISGRDNFFTFGIVPYTFHRRVTRTQRRIIQRVMDHYQHLTCIRFVPRVSRDRQWAKDLYNLGHNGYVEFVQEETCFGGLGNNGGRNSVSCCGRDQCIHEIGHALGMIHEHQHPGREGFLRINYNRIPDAKKIRYALAPEDTIVDGYPFDVSSPMGYDYDTSFTKKITLLTPDISPEIKDFYMFQEISNNHKCHENNCSSFDMTCTNDGYVTMVGNACACRCPEGLNPDTGCSTLLSEERQTQRCGGIFNLDAQNPTVIFKKFPNQPYECSWLINVPDGDTMTLEFTEFNIGKRFGECEDEVEIRNSRLGHGGKRYCGEKAPTLVKSYFNRMMISFSPSRRQRPVSTFNVTARLVRADSLCYNASDKGYSYGGTVNYARDYTKCIPWSQAAHCPYNPYNFKDMSARLDGNNCRNPGNGLMPWCYVNAYTCKRKYCDVCNVDVPFDKRPFVYCRWMTGMYNYCLDEDDESRWLCAKTCREYLLPPKPSASTVTCARPPAMADSDQIEKQNQTQFSVGESVTFKCRNPNNLFQTTLKKYCLTTGNWSAENTACIPCHSEKGYDLYNQSCYKVLTEHKTANQHQTTCQRMGGQLADVRTMEEQTYVTDLAIKLGAVNLYIGAHDMYMEGTFRFRDYSAVTWAPWGALNRNRPRQDCVWSSVYNKWFVDRCNSKKPAVCKMPMLRHERRGGARCSDSRDDCATILEEDGEMCQRRNGTFAFSQCTSTCGQCL